MPGLDPYFFMHSFQLKKGAKPIKKIRKMYLSKALLVKLKTFQVEYFVLKENINKINVNDEVKVILYPIDYAHMFYLMQ